MIRQYAIGKLFVTRSENEREFLNRENVRRDKINQQKQRRRLFDDAVKKLYFPKKNR